MEDDEVDDGNSIRIKSRQATDTGDTHGNNNNNHHHHHRPVYQAIHDEDDGESGVDTLHGKGIASATAMTLRPSSEFIRDLEDQIRLLDDAAPADAPTAAAAARQAQGSMSGTPVAASSGDSLDSLDDFLINNEHSAILGTGLLTASLTPSSPSLDALSRVTPSEERPSWVLRVDTARLWSNTQLLWSLKTSDPGTSTTACTRWPSRLLTS